MYLATRVKANATNREYLEIITKAKTSVQCLGNDY